MARWRKVFDQLRMLRLRDMKPALDSIPGREQQQIYLRDQDLQTMTSMSDNSKERLDYLSNLKVLLTALVILHHTAVAYGGAGQIIYHAPTHPPGSESVLVALNAVNQTFFMALFFFVAGFLSLRSVARRVEKSGLPGLGGFVRDRAWRLGGPTAVYTLCGPIACNVIATIGRGDRLRGTDVWEQVAEIRGVRGPVWFCALLLVFDILLVIGWLLSETDRHLIAADRILLEKAADPAERKGVRVAGIKPIAALAVLTLLDFIWRLYFPVGRIFTPLNLNLGYLPQYIAAYIFGVMVPDPLYVLPKPRILFILGIFSTVTGVVLTHAMVTRHSHDGDDPDPTAGGWTQPAATYAIWNNITGYLIVSGLLRLFHEHVSRPCNTMSNLANTTFLLHIPVSTAGEVSLEKWHTSPIVKTILVGGLNIIASWSAAWLWEATTSMLWFKVIAAPAEAVRTHDPGCRAAGRRRTMSRGERAIEILEGLDEVGR